MNTKSTLKRRILSKNSAFLLPLLGLSVAPAYAQLWWDRNSTDPGAGIVTGGTWDATATNPNWNTDINGVLAPGVWTAGQIANFSAGNDATGTFTVTITGTQTTGGVNIEEGNITFASGTAALGTNALTIALGASLTIDSPTRISGTAGSSKVTLNGGTLINTASGNAGSFISANSFLEIGPLGGTVNYASTGAGLVSIYGGATGGTITGTGTLTKTGLLEFRYQGTGLPNTTFSKLVVAGGLYRLGFNSSISDERGFGAVPASFLPDAITLTTGGSIGTSFTAANSVLHVNRGVTLGPGGGSINGSMTIPGAITGAGNLSHITTGTLVLSGANNYTGATIVTTGIVQLNSATALGSTIGDTQVSGAGEVRVDGAASNFTINEPFQIAGPGGGGGGAITVQNLSSPTFSGPITLTGDAAITVSGTATVTYNNSNAFTSVANQNLTLQGGGITTGGGGTISGVIALGSGGLTKLQGGKWTVSGANTYTGTTTISAGTLSASNIVVTGGASNLGNATSKVILGTTAAATLSYTGNSATYTRGFDVQSFGGRVDVTTAGQTLSIDTGAITGAGILTLGGVGNFNVSAPVQTTNSLVKDGTGTLTFSGVQAFPNVITINAGTLNVAGALNGTAAVEIFGTLSGTGSIVPAAAGNVTLFTGGKLAPGVGGIGNLSVTLSGNGKVDVSQAVGSAASGALVFELNSTGASDKVTITGGALDIGANSLEFDDFTFTALGGLSGISGPTDFVLFNGDTPIVTTLGSATSGFVDGFAAQIQFADNNNDLILHVVPEPGSAALLLGGLSLLMARRRRNS